MKIKTGLLNMWVRLITSTVITAMVCQNIVWAGGSGESKLAKGSIFDDSGDIKAHALDTFLTNPKTRDYVFGKDKGRLPKVPAQIDKVLKGFFKIKGEMTVEGDNAVVNIELDRTPARLFFSTAIFANYNFLQQQTSASCFS